MADTEKIFKQFENDVNRLLKNDKDFWKCARIAAGNLQDTYSDEELFEASGEMKNLPYENADMAGILIHSEISMKYCVTVDAAGNKHPVEYSREYEKS